MRLPAKFSAPALFWKSISGLMFIQFYFYYTVIENKGFFV